MLKVFVKTFVLCIVLCGIWTIWSYFQNDGFDSEINVKPEVYSKVNPKEEETQKEEKTEVKKEQNVKIYFLNSKNEVVEIQRKMKEPNLKKAINSLLKGTTSDEKKMGLYSEIPNDVILLDVTPYSDKIIVNLNSKFVRGGGTTTILNRIKQLKKTVDAQSGNKPIYLQIEGKQVEYIGGDGVYLEQPLNEDVLK